MQNDNNQNVPLVEFGDEVEISNLFRTAQTHQPTKQKRRQESVYEYIDELFRRYSKLIIVRVDLHYRDTIGQSKTIDEALSDFKHFRNCERYNDTIFNGKVGWVRLLECGQEMEGLHFHYMAFYDANVQRNDVELARNIGEFWIRINDGFGHYWNCNEKQYDFKAIGVLVNNDYTRISKLKSVVATYLTKLTQQPHYSYKRQLFATGQLQHLCIS